VCDKGHTSWNNPKAAASVILYRQNKILFSVRGIEPHKNKIDLPGGFLQFDEQPVSAAKREIQEETGLTLHKLEPVAAYTRLYDENISVTDVVFLCCSWSGEEQPNDDVAELTWMPIDAIDSPEFAWQYPGLTDTLKGKLL